MSDLTTRQRAGIAAVARCVAGSRAEWSEERSGARLRVGRKRIALEVMTIGGGKSTGGTQPRLRFDRVVQAIGRRLEAALEALVPQGRTVMITITAPILQPGRTAAAVVERIGHSLRRSAARLAIDETLHGNRFRAVLVKRPEERIPKVIVFVHNPDAETDVPGALFGLARSLLEHVGTARDRNRPKKGRTGERWLALVAESGLSHPATLQHVTSRLGIAASYRKVLLVLADGRVATLAG